jgi:uncharacterized protein (TIGR02594 family)
MRFLILLLVLLILITGYIKTPPVVPNIESDLAIIEKPLTTTEIESANRQVILVSADLNNKISVASRYMGFHQRTHRRELKEFMRIDPIKVEWCAAFINAVLKELGIPGSETVSKWPLTARSFLRWGKRVKTPIPGDIVILPRGTEPWQGHAGFYYDTEYKNGVKYYLILGGNQSNAVTISAFPASTVISIRRYIIAPPK